MPQARPFSLITFSGPPPPLPHPFYLGPKKTVAGGDYYLVYVALNESVNQTDFLEFSKYFNSVNQGAALTFWNGPDETGKAVIAKPIPAGTQPAENGTQLASVAFNKTTPADNTFTDLVVNIAKDPNASIEDASQALIWLADNGMWTNYTPNTYLFPQKQLVFTTTSANAGVVPQLGGWNYCDGAARLYFKYDDAAAPETVPIPRWIAANYNTVWAAAFDGSIWNLYEFSWTWTSLDGGKSGSISNKYILSPNFLGTTGISTFSDFGEPSRYLIAINSQNGGLYKLDLTTQSFTGGPLLWNTIIFRPGGNLEQFYGNPLRTSDNKFIILGINARTGGFYLNQYAEQTGTGFSNAWGVNVSIQLDTPSLLTFSPANCNLFVSWCIEPGVGEVYALYILDSKSYKVWRINATTHALTYTGKIKPGTAATNSPANNIEPLSPMTFAVGRSVLISKPQSTAFPFFYYDALEGRVIDATPHSTQWPGEEGIAFSTILTDSVIALDGQNRLLQWTGRGIHPFAVSGTAKSITPDTSALNWSWRDSGQGQGTGIAAMGTQASTSNLLAYNEAFSSWCVLELASYNSGTGNVSWQKLETVPWIRRVFGYGFPIGNPIWSKSTSDERAIFLEVAENVAGVNRAFIVQYWYDPYKDLIPEEIIEVTSEVMSDAIFSKSTKAAAIFTATSATGNNSWLFIKASGFTFHRIDLATRQKTQVSLPGFSLNSALLNDDNLTNISAISSAQARFADKIYYFDASANLDWPDIAAEFYFNLAGGFTDSDKGYSTREILSTKTFSIWSKQNKRSWRVSTDGYVSLETELDGVFTGPFDSALPNLNVFFGNAADLILDQSLANTDGSAHGVWYKNETNSIKFVVECGEKDYPQQSASYLINIYRDQNYQWIETRLKTNPYSLTGAKCGIYSDNDLNSEQLTSTTSKVWLGSNNGLVWQYMGEGSVKAASLGLRLSFTSQSALASWMASALNGSPYSVSTWNSYLIEPGVGVPFTSAAVLTDSVILIGGSDLELKGGIFDGVTSIIGITDELGCVKKVGETAFKNATGLAKISLNAVQEIKALAFAVTTSLGNIGFSNLTVLGPGAFSQSSITAFVAPLLTTVGSEAFLGTQLTSISLPSVTTIGEKAFFGTATYNITSISIPACTQLGLPNQDNLIFGSNAAVRPNFTLTVPSALMTVNGGQPDPDIAVYLTGPTPIVTVIQV